MTEGSVSHPSEASRPRRVLLLVAKDEFGQDPPELGWTLMRSFLKALGASDTKPERAIFINTGVRLTTEGSQVLDDVRALEGAGVRILSCVTCLEYFGLADKLEVGEATNMNDTVHALMAADHLVSP